jgi:CRP/FNR family transcriptional regulator/CRP/FNR family cyclic AMP-dependent transcriptional regulator
MMTTPTLAPVQAGFEEERMTPAPLGMRSPLFAPLEEEEQRALADSCRTRRFRAGEVLFHEGDPGHALFLLRSGHVKIVQIAADGAELILHVYGPGDTLGELALVDDGPRSATAVAMERVEALALHREEFLALLARHPAVAIAVLNKVISMVRRLNQQMHAVLSLDATGRLAQKLLELADLHGQETAEGIRIGIRITQEQLAQMVGAARSTVNKQLGWFMERGTLTVEREQIVIHRPDQLRQRVY